MIPDRTPLARTGSLLWRGLWDEKVSYSHPDAVTERGLNYVAISPNVGVSPGSDNGARWRLLAGPGSKTRTVIFYLGDSLLDNGSCNYLNGGKGDKWASNGPTWGPVANAILGLPCVPRWTPAGSVAGQLGTNYAVAGASVSAYITPVNTSLLAQISKLLTDYPHGLPPNSLVVIFIGNNDVGAGGTVPAGGGVWSEARWQTIAPFKIPPAKETAVVPVETSAGAIAGSSNYIILLTRSGALGPYTISAIQDGTHLAIQNPFALAAGTEIPSGATIHVYASYFLRQELEMLSPRIGNLISAGAKIVWTNVEKLSLLPIFSKSLSSLADASVAYWNSTAQSLIHPGSTRNIELFDIATVYQDMCGDPSKYGFKDAATPWNNSTTIDPDDLIFYDNAHLTAAAHRFIAKRFLEMLHRRDLVTVA